MVFGFDVLQRQVDNEIVARVADRHAVAAADERLQRGLIEQPSGQSNRQPALSPTRDVEEQIEKTVHQAIRVSPEVTPVVVVHELGGGDLRPRGKRSQLSLLGSVERPIHGAEFIVLILAHLVSTSSDGASPTESCLGAAGHELYPRSYKGTAVASASGASTKS
jgi:hypothetical protein